jgi:3'-phosphoadenosine 5'-phosphosulfate sulfotransferase (PAPS reductase)/FAD synthetase
MPTREDLKILQAQDLELKVALTKQRIREWVTEFSSQGVYVSFSGGKDSTVLLHLVRSIYPDVEAVFVNTGLEYPEIQRFVKTFENVRILYPKKTFKQVISEYGYPMISKDVSQSIYEAQSAGKESRTYQKFIPNSPYNLKYGGKFSMEKWEPLLHTDFRLSHLCCHQNKKNPAKKYEKEFDKHPITATMTCESRLRESMWLQTGCNAFDAKRPQSKPMSFWTEQDVLQYIKEENIPIASVYGDIIPVGGQMSFEGCDCKLCTTGCDRTGCIFCGFGAHLEKGEGRFQRLKRTHPKQYDFCINGGGYDENGIWKPNDKGLGMGHVFDELNKLYGENFIKYK